MASNPYNNKVVLGDGTVLMDITDTTATAADVAIGKYFYTAAGEKVEGTMDVLNTFFPVGSVYTSSSATAPTFGGTWQEVKVMVSLEGLKTGDRNYVQGTGAGTLHYWIRTA